MLVRSPRHRVPGGRKFNGAFLPPAYRCFAVAFVVVGVVVVDDLTLAHCHTGSINTDTMAFKGRS